MRHITLCILIAATLALSAYSTDSSLSSSNNSNEYSSDNQGSKDGVSSKQATDVIGTWEQEQGEGKRKSSYTASVTEDVITVEWGYGTRSEVPL